MRISWFWVAEPSVSSPISIAFRSKSNGSAARYSIVNFSSTTTVLMLPGYAAYVATKGAVEQLSHVLAKELGPKKITVNVVSPGPTDTELFGQGKTEEQKQTFARMAALGRLGQPETSPPQ